MSLSQSQESMNNEVIIPSDNSGHTTRGVYSGIIDAISQIQQYAVMEEDRDIPEDFMTLAGKLNFLNVGFSHGFFEGLLFGLLTTLIMPVLADEQLRQVVGTYLPVLGSPLFLWALNCSPIIVMGGICCYLARYRVGNITKKAVDAFLAGRMMSLMIKGIIIFSLLCIISNKITSESAWWVANFVTFKNYAYASNIYRILMSMKPYMLSAAWEIIGIFFVATIIPLLTVWAVTIYRRARQYQEDRFWRN